MTDHLSSEQVRAGTRELYSALGLGRLIHGPPLLEASEMDIRPMQVIVSRALAIFAALCVAYEPVKTRAAASKEVVEWLTLHHLDSNLTTVERSVVMQVARRDAGAVESEVESLYALAWALNLVDDLDPRRYVPDTFGGLFPNISRGSKPDVFASDARLRARAEIIGQLDLYYCLHWSLREAERKASGFSLPVEPYVIRYRRLALEWLTSDDQWDDISLDT